MKKEAWPLFFVAGRSEASTCRVRTSVRAAVKNSRASSGSLPGIAGDVGNVTAEQGDGVADLADPIDEGPNCWEKAVVWPRKPLLTLDLPSIWFTCPSRLLTLFWVCVRVTARAMRPAAQQSQPQQVEFSC